MRLFTPVRAGASALHHLRPLLFSFFFLLTLILDTNYARAQPEGGPGTCDFQVKLISSNYAAGSTTFILEVKQGILVKQAAISHMTFKLPEGPCAPPYIGTPIEDWAAAYYGSSATGPWSSAAIKYGKDPSGCAEGDVFKIDEGISDEIFYVKIVLTGNYTGAFPDIQMKYGIYCCTVQVGENNSGGFCWNIDCSLDLTIQADPIRCHGGTTKIVATPVANGAPITAYTLAPGNIVSANGEFEGITPGTYTVTITEGACTATATITLTEPPLLEVSAQPTNPNCSNGTGTIDITITGGTLDYSFAWSDGSIEEDRTGLAAGTYTVTVTDANGCTAETSATIVIPPLLEVTALPTNPDCFGGTGSIDITVTGGTPDYSYAWSDASVEEDRTGLAAGTYTVTVTDANGCTAEAAATIVIPPLLEVTALPTNPDCFGGTGSIEITATGGTPDYSYAWSDGSVEEDRTGLAAGTYTVTVTDANGCTAEAAATIVIPTLLEVTALPTNPNCFGGTGSIEITATGGTPDYSYAWSDGSVEEDRTGLAAGTYTLTVTDANGCTAETAATIVIPEDIKVVAVVPGTPICEGNTAEITVTAYGGTGILEYSLDGIEYHAFTSVNAGIYTVTLNIGATTTIQIKDENDCSKSVEVSVTVRKCENFCTYTQGYFGNDEGLSSNPGGGGNASYVVNGSCVQSRVNATIAKALSSASLPSMLGNIPIGNLTPDQIIAYLPGGGPSGQYTGNTLPAAKNTLIAQLLTLALNLGLNGDLGQFVLPESGVIYTQKTSDCGSGTATGTCNAYFFNEIGKGKTVAQLYALASTALKSGTNAERSAYANVADAINKAFDECAKVCIPESILDQSNLLTFASTQRPTVSATARNINVKAYPNPFTDRIFIQFTSPVAGKAVVQIFDMSGRRIAEINKGQVTAGMVNKVEYLVPNNARSGIIYKVTVGSYSFTGRMIDASAR